MEDLIAKYLYNVTKNLPIKIKQDVEDELRSNIYDMLLEDYSLENVKKVLTEIGNPKEISKLYLDKSNYLVSPNDYDRYKLTLNTVLIISSITFFFFGAVFMLDASKEKTVLNKVISILLGGVISSALSIIMTYGIVTFIFHMIGLTPKRTIPFDISKLEEIPKNKNFLISKKNVLIKMTILSILGIMGLYILTFYSDFSIFGLQMVFNKKITNIFIPLFLVSLIFLIVGSVIKNKKTVITYKTIIIDTIYNIYTGVILIVFILQEELLVSDFYNNINMKTYQLITILLSIFVALLILLEIAFKWYKIVRKAK